MANLTDIISFHAKNSPNNIAVNVLNKSVTYAEFDTMIWQAAMYLYGKNISLKDVIGLNCQDEFMLMVIMLAVARMGGTTYSGNGTSMGNMEVFSNLKVKCIITDKDFENENILNIKIDLLSIQKINNVDYLIREQEPTSPWLIISGSGTTGKSKLLSISHTQQIQRMESALQWLHAGKGDTVASLVHLTFHVSKMLYLEALYAGLTISLTDKRNRDVLLSVQNIPVTILHATVFHIQLFLQYPQNNLSKYFSSLKLLLVGGSSVSMKTRSMIRSKLTSNLCIRYGAIEVDTASVSFDSEVFNESDSVGRSVENTTIEIVDVNEKQLPANIIGDIRIKSLGMLDKYIEDETATRMAFRGEWFYPGDLGMFRKDGQLIHLGRSDDMILLNGVNIYPSEIERVLFSHPNITDAAAFSITSDNFGQIPVAAVQLTPDAEIKARQLMMYCREQLGIRAPRRIFVVPKLNRNAQGKFIKKNILSILDQSRKNDD